MVVYICPDCNKEFNRKSNYDFHTLNRKNPCNKSNFTVVPKPTKVTEEPENIVDLLLKNVEPSNNSCACVYCDKIFTRMDSLKKHLNGRCKTKENYEELDKLKEDMKVIIDNYQKLENNFNHLLKEKNEKPNEQDPSIIDDKDETKMINGTINNKVNKGVILNNNVNIQVVQFGNEDIDKLNLIDGIKTYLKSTGGNIISNMIKYINLNKEYPENNNICMTDMSREIVKIHNGKKFVYKKFKNVKDDILNKIVENTRKIVDKYEKNENLKKSADTKNKLKINEVSLKIIDGVSAEDIVRDEINEKEKEKKINMNEIYDSESEEERDFTFEERLRIDHLENKRDGLQKKTFENIKDELYNAKELLENIN
jgi:hypothetical protein